MKQAILLAAYGAGGVQGAHTLQLFERMVREAYPDSSIRWAFTSMLMRNRLAAARKKTDSIAKALCRLGFERYTHVAVQSLHMIPGSEYEDLQNEVAEAQKCGAPAKISIGTPLLHSRLDIEQAADAIIGSLPAERVADEAVIWVGHGTAHEGGSAYDHLTNALQARDRNIFIGTIAREEQGVEQLLPSLRERGVSRAWLMPLLSVVGKHAMQDIAGEGKDSWRHTLEQYEISCKAVLRGAIEYQGFADIWMNHLREAMAAYAK